MTTIQRSMSPAKKCFAYVPVKLHNGSWIWWTEYWVVVLVVHSIGGKNSAHELPLTIKWRYTSEEIMVVNLTNKHPPGHEFV